jgi:hypothetical protein
MPLILRRPPSGPLRSRRLVSSVAQSAKLLRFAAELGRASTAVAACGRSSAPGPQPWPRLLHGAKDVLASRIVRVR